MYDKKNDYILKSQNNQVFALMKKNNMKITKFIIKIDRNIVNSVSV